MQSVKSFPCHQCKVIFSRSYNLRRHIERYHNHIQPMVDCTLCGAYFHHLSQLREHRRVHKPTTGFKKLQSAFKKSCVIFRKIYAKKILSFEEANALDYSDSLSLLNYEQLQRQTFKVSRITTVEFVKTTSLEGELERTYDIRFRSPTTSIQNQQDISDFMDSSTKFIQNRIDDFIAHGSGWVLDEVLYSDLELGSCAPLKGGCNAVSIKFLKNLKLIHPNSTAQDCFFQAIAYHFVKSDKPKKLRRFIRRKIITEIKTPVHVSDIRKFEKDNQHLRLKINVLYSEDGGKTVVPIYTSKNKSTKNIINLMLWKTVVNGELMEHFSYIEHLSKFLRKSYRYNVNHEFVTYEKLYACGNCLTTYSRLESLRSHEELCLKFKTQKIVTPPKDSCIEFRNFRKKFKVPYVGFFDFESCLKPINRCQKCDVDETCVHASITANEQKPITYSYVIVDSNSNVIHTNTYSGEDCIEHFLNELLTLEGGLLEKMSECVPMVISPLQQAEFNDTLVCHICEKDILPGDAVRDHCHLTGRYMGAAHNLCNLLRQEVKFIPFFAHNFTGYDSHFIMQCLKKDKRIKNISALPLNSEKFRTIQLNSFHFIDSLSFLNASLTELVDDLVEEKNKKNMPFTVLNQMPFYTRDIQKQQPLLLRKGVFPYEHITSSHVLLSPLPTRDKFFSKLSNSGISEEDYKHAEKVYKDFKCANMKDYCELYCATDTFLLAEVILHFRNDMYNMFDLDCCHYISLPQMAYDVMLKTTRVKIEQITDLDMMMFFEDNIRGGVSFINQRHCKATSSNKAIDEHIEMLYIDGMYIFKKAHHLVLN